MDPNDDGTVARRGRPVDFVSNSSVSAHTLPEGSRLLDYEVTGLIGEGGFGIVYLAWDHSLQRRIAIKEYMPSSMASRAHSSAAVVLKSERHADTFRAGLKSFVNEARLLARFNHPALVKVYRFWEQNGTAYMVMPHYAGPTLKQALATRDQPPDEAELRDWLRPLLDALAVMHAAHCFHRDIAPDNILLTPAGPLLLDFGAARRVIGDMTHALTVVLKPGFAPIEQYGEIATMAQGAWTDLYALASVVYAAVAGKPPMSSVERLMGDRLLPFGRLPAGRYSPAFAAAIDAALAVRPGDRPQDVAAFRALLDARTPDGRQVREPPRPVVMATRSASRGAPDPTPSSERTAPTPLPSSGFAGVPPSALATRLRRPRTALVAVLLTLGLGAAAYLAASAWHGRARPAATAASSPAAAFAAPAPAPALTPAPAPGPAPAPASVSVPTPTANAPMPPVEPTAEPAPMSSGRPVSMDRPPAPTSSAPPAVKAKREPRAATTPPVRRPPAAPDADDPAAAARSRCGELLQKASLEPLTAGEAAYLKRECR